MREMGSVFYVAVAQSEERWRPCPTCAGKKRVTLILGSGEHVELGCDYCGKGYEGPQGREMFYEFTPRVELRTVSGFEMVDGNLSYRAPHLLGGHWRYDATDCYDTEEEAHETLATLIAEREIEEHARLSRKVKADKSYAWHAGYHLREAKKARESAERHEKSATLMKARARTPEEVTPRPPWRRRGRPY